MASAGPASLLMPLHSSLATRRRRQTDIASRFLSCSFYCLYCSVQGPNKMHRPGRSSTRCPREHGELSSAVALPVPYECPLHLRYTSIRLLLLATACPYEPHAPPSTSFSRSATRLLDICSERSLLATPNSVLLVLVLGYACAARYTPAQRQHVACTQHSPKELEKAAF